MKYSSSLFDENEQFCQKREFSNSNKEILIIQQKNRLDLQMQTDFKVKNKLSYSPTRTNDNVFTMRARIGKKLKHLNQKLQLDPRAQLNRNFSQSAHKLKAYGSNLFSGAHKIDSRETYLFNEKNNKLSITKDSSTPMSPLKNKNKVLSGSPFTKILRSQSLSRWDGVDRGNKDIQRTVSIAIKGKREDLPNQQKLMTTLSKIILGGQKCQDDFYLQFIGESSIYGEQQNFIQLDSFLFKEDFNLDLNKLKE